MEDKMSDSTQQYILKQPIDKDLLTLLLEQHWVSGFKEAQKKTADIYTTKKHSASFMEKLFVPLDIPAIEKQLETKFEDAIDCGYLLGKAELAKVRTLDELVEVQKIRIRQLTDEVMRVFGLENKENHE